MLVRVKQKRSDQGPVEVVQRLRAQGRQALHSSGLLLRQEDPPAPLRSPAEGARLSSAAVSFVSFHSQFSFLLFLNINLEIQIRNILPAAAGELRP